MAVYIALYFAFAPDLPGVLDGCRPVAYVGWTVCFPAATLKDFETEYMQRLQGIAASHDLLVNQNWTGAPLNELIRRQVEPFVETNRANLAISGPDIIISASPSLCLVLPDTARFSPDLSRHFGHYPALGGAA